MKFQRCFTHLWITVIICPISSYSVEGTFSMWMFSSQAIANIDDVLNKCHHCSRQVIELLVLFLERELSCNLLNSLIKASILQFPSSADIPVSLNFDCFVILTFTDSLLFKINNDSFKLWHQVPDCDIYDKEFLLFNLMWNLVFSYTSTFSYVEFRALTTSNDLILCLLTRLIYGMWCSMYTESSFLVLNISSVWKLGSPFCCSLTHWWWINLSISFKFRPFLNGYKIFFEEFQFIFFTSFAQY